VLELQYKEVRLYFPQSPLLAAAKAGKIPPQMLVTVVAVVAQELLFLPTTEEQGFLVKVLREAILLW